MLKSVTWKNLTIICSKERRQAGEIRNWKETYWGYGWMSGDIQVRESKRVESLDQDKKVPQQTKIINQQVEKFTFLTKLNKSLF